MFDNIKPTDPCDMMFLICQYISYWSDMQKTRTIEALQQGVDQLKVIFKHVFSRAKGWVLLCQRKTEENLCEESVIFVLA
jgi:hypothetical protein